jgi:hypothetical protein
MSSNPITPEWLIANDFDTSDYRGYERFAADRSWIRWHYGNVYLGRGANMQAADEDGHDDP